MAKNNGTNTSKSIIQLVIDGKGAETSVNQLGGALNQVNKELRAMKANDSGRDGLIEQKRAISAEYEKQKKQIGDIRTGWQKFRSEFVTIATGVVGGNLITAMSEKLLMYLPQLTAHSLKLKDELSDVAKKTDMTDREVNKLNSSIKKINTRTATSELREMAGVGGQFGVAKNQIEGFVSGADKVNVALGDQFGGAEATAGAVLKLRNIFQNLKSDNIEQDMLKIGNGLNVLEADGAATGAGMADFSSRIGGTLIPLKVTEAQVLGLSATLEELNVTAERGSTATVDIFQRMLTETETFAKVAGIPLKEYKKLIQDDIFGAFMKYLEGLKKVVPNQIEFMSVLEKSKLTGSGASEVLSKLAANSEMLTGKITKAGTALQNTDSIMAEFQKRNHSLALGMKQLSEWWNGLLYSDTAQGFVEGTVAMLTAVMGLRDEIAEARAEFEKQNSAINQLDSALPPLLKKHAELSLEVLTTGKRQKELHDITQKIASIVPQAVTAWDDYGNAIDVDREKLEQFLIVQRRAFEETKKQTAEKIRIDIANKNKRLTEVNGQIRDGMTVEVEGDYGFRRDLSADEINELRKEAETLQKELGKSELEFAQLTGIISQKDIDRHNRLNRPEKTQPTVNPNKIKSPLGDEEDKKRKKKQTYGYEELQAAKDAEIEAYADLDERVAEERKKGLANLLKDLGIEYDTYYLSIEQKAAQGLLTEEELDRLKKEKKVAQLGAEIMFRQLYDEDTLSLERELAQAEIDLAQDTADKKTEILKASKKADDAIKKEVGELNEKQFTAEKQIADNKRELWQQGTQALMGMAKQQSGIWKALFLVQKGLAIADIIATTTVAITKYQAALANYSLRLSASMGADVGAWAGLAATTAQITAAKTSAGVSIASIAAQAIPVFAGREAGGSAPTLSVNKGEAAGRVDRPTLFGQSAFVAGEGFRPEYIIPWRMMQDPVVANMAGMIEDLRPRYYSSAGNTPPSPSKGKNAGPLMSDALLMRMIIILEGIEEKSEKKIVFNRTEFDREGNRFNFIRDDTSS
ncbi:phage tail tape measure protein [Runella sp.]|uniref:phage tail tape measure protein n=1 Tax=Runella sp. TaxID=1960881 RepID=UPI003D0DB459